MSFLSYLGSFVSSNIRDFIFFGGLVATGYGVWMLYGFYAFIVCGAILMLFSLGWLTRIKSVDKPE